MTRFDRLAGEIKTIGSIELAIKAKSILEKFLWIAFFIVGVGWLGYFMKGTFEDVNPTTSMRLTKKIEELNYPAITICSDVTTKYAIAEQFGNYLDPAELPKEFEDLKATLFRKTFQTHTGVGDCSTNGWHYKSKKCTYIKILINPQWKLVMKLEIYRGRYKIYIFFVNF